ncbi:hypothetical protein FPV67DRAFT_1777489 [Lyophyllum atratum]|nr:hypothetical protein FPV67DRAFT_1777489 [Lyophyllum atratum]
MGQYFEVINLDNPFPVSTTMSGKFGECFWGMNAETDRGVINALWQTDTGHKTVTIQPLSQLEPLGKHRNSFDESFVLPGESVANASLPTELLNMILEELEGMTDLVCFMLTCQRYYEIGRPILEAHLEDILTYSWAGNRLICAGDYASVDDLPQGMLTEDEVEILDEEFQPTDDDQYDTGISERLCFVQRLQPDWYLNRARGGFRQQNHRLSWYFISLWDPKFRERSLVRVGRGDIVNVDVLQALTEVTPRALPDGIQFSNAYGSYVLRNLTTKEYIRGDAIRQMWDTPVMPYLKALRFLHLLVLRITWSSDSSLSIAYEGPIQVHRGVWAGHRFDFSEIKTVQGDEGAMGDWKDVSKVAIDELVAVFEPEAKSLDVFLTPHVPCPDPWARFLLELQTHRSDGRGSVQ